MSLTTLPPEILDIIVGHLDTTSLYKLYKSGIVSLQGLITEFHFSFNTLATAKILESNFFRDTSRNLKVLDMSCARDLECPTLLGAMRFLHNLTELDVSYTKITMPDFLRFSDMAPKLNSIAINFVFGVDCQKMLHKYLIWDYQEAFIPFKNVKFVSYPSVVNETFRTKVAVHLLRKASNLEKLQFEFASGPSVDRFEPDYQNCEMVDLSEFHIHHLRGYGLRELPIFDVMDLSRYEIAIFKTDFRDHYGIKEQRLFVTPLVKQVIPDDFHIDVQVLVDSIKVNDRYYDEILREELEETFAPESVFLFFERSRNTFDQSFYTKLCKILKPYTIFSCKSPYLNVISEVPALFNSYNIHHCVLMDEHERKTFFEVDYGFAFKQHVDVKLDWETKYNREAIRMLNNFDFLQKLSHLSITSGVQYGADLYKTIFKECVNLQTLQVIGCDINEPTILQHIGLSKTLKNILIQEIKTGLNVLFGYLSECRTLENIVIFTGNLILPNPVDMIKNCKNLYSIGIYSGISYDYNSALAKEVKNKYSKAFEVIKGALGRHGLHIDVNDFIQFINNPFLRVFSMLQLASLRSIVIMLEATYARMRMEI